MTFDALRNPEFSFAGLWAQLHDLFEMMRMALGEPQDLMDMVRPSRREMRFIMEWIAPLETLIRRLLLIEAASIIFKPRKNSERKISKAPAAAERDAFPDALKLRFHVPIPPPIHERGVLRGFGPRILSLAPDSRPFFPKKFPNIWRRSFSPAVLLAVRYASMQIVIANPTPYARRLARRLRGKVPAAKRLLMRPHFYSPNIADEALHYAMQLGFEAAEKFADTS